MRHLPTAKTQKGGGKRSVTERERAREREGCSEVGKTTDYTFQRPPCRHVSSRQAATVQLHGDRRRVHGRAPARVLEELRACAGIFLHVADKGGIRTLGSAGQDIVTVIVCGVVDYISRQACRTYLWQTGNYF